MPQDGSNNYQYPPGTPGVPDQTIESEAYNTFIDDLITNDLNIARPIHRGGTGATNVTAALNNLTAEKAMQQVANYDTHVWQAGSFWSNAGATTEPVAGQHFVGTCIIHGNPDYITLEAVSVATGAQYGRQKVAGVWGAWTELTSSVAAADARYVNASGDTMTGALTLASDPTVGLHAATRQYVDSTTVSLTGDAMTGMLTSAPSSGTIAASAGPAGSIQVMSAPSVENGAFMTFHNPVSFAFNFGMDSDAKLKVGGFSMGANAYEIFHQGNFNPANYLPITGGTVTGSLIVTGSVSTGDVMAARTPTTGYYFFGTSGTKYLGYDGASFILNGAPLYVQQDIQGLGPNLVMASNPGGAIYFRPHGAAVATSQNHIDSAGNINSPCFQPLHAANGGYRCKTGDGNTLQANYFNFSWAPGLSAFVDNTYLGFVTVSSDYRIKKDVVDLPSTWDTVKLLRPIKYTQAQFTPPGQIEAYAKEKLRVEKENETLPEDKKLEPRTITPMFEADDIERWGFIAHELQATLVMSAATAEKDAPTAVQSPNPWTVIAALTKTIQEMQTRIEALEAT